jgi:hypothetical protein
MEVKVIYSEHQLMAAVNFIAEHNRYFIGQYSTVEARIRSMMYEMIEDFPNQCSIGTMGFTIVASIESEEGIDGEDNIIDIGFLVDPTVSSHEESTEKIFNIVRGSNV